MLGSTTVRGGGASYYYQNKDHHREVADAWMKANPEKVKEIKKKWKLNNPLQVKVDNSKRQAILRTQKILWNKELTDFVFEEAHDLRLLRNEATSFNWHVDHIIPLQGKLVCGLHVWNNFAVIPAIVNLRKNNRYALSEEWCPPV